MTSWVWGVDVAVSHLAFAFADVSSGDVTAETLLTRTSEREGARLAYVLSMVRRYAFEARRRFPPAVVWVEMAAGKFRSPQLVYVVGVVQAGLSEALGVPVWSLPSSAWKKRTVGVGNATKAQVASHVERLGIGFASQDEADAICVASAGRKMLEVGAWDVAA